MTQLCWSIILAISSLMFNFIIAAPATTLKFADNLPPCNETLDKNEMGKVSFFTMGNQTLYTNYVDISVKSDVSCTIDYKNLTDLVIPDTSVVFYLQLKCKREVTIILSNTHLVKQVRPLPIGYLWLYQCHFSWRDISTVGQTLDLRVLYLHGWRDTNPDWLYVQEKRSQDRNFTSEEQPRLPIVPLGLKNIGSLLIYHSEMENGTILDIFSKFIWPNMAEIAFGHCDIYHIPWGTLKYTMPKLQAIQFDNNKITNLPKFPWNMDMLNLPRGLRRTMPANNHYGQYMQIPPNVYRRIFVFDNNQLGDNLGQSKFEGTIDKISLKHNNLTIIGRDCFKLTNGLQLLDLSYNSLLYLPVGLFEGLYSIRRILLSFNKLLSVPFGMFSNLQFLSHILLNNNNITSINSGVFPPLPTLKKVDISFNNVTFLSNEAFSLESIKLQVINISHNRVKKMPGWTFLFRSISTIDFSHNNVDFKGFVGIMANVSVSKLEFQNVDSVSTYGSRRRLKTKTIILHNNQMVSLDTRLLISEQMQQVFGLVLDFYDIVLGPDQLHCDCITRLMSAYLKGKHNAQNKEGVYIEQNHYAYDNWICSWPNDVKGRRMIHVKEDDFRCIIRDPKCPQSCQCTNRSESGVVVVDCSNRNLTSFPADVPENTTELYMQFNKVTSLYQSYHYAGRLTTLNISSNGLTTVTNTVLEEFKSLEYFYINDNSLTVVPDTVTFLPLKVLLMSNNDIRCDCNALWLKHWVLDNTDLIPDYSKIICASGIPQGTALFAARNSLFICHVDPARYMAIGLGVVVLITVICAILVFRHRAAIKLILFTRFNLHPFDNSSGQEYISSMKYDAFISYCAAEYKWVCFEFRQRLEQQGYRLCLHDRDFLPGAPIEDNIINAIRQSRRMIMVLSNNYLSSDWCMLEFRAAHQKVLKHVSNYLILLLYSDVETSSISDSTLRLYMDTHTYLSMDNKWFWDKVLYAMPRVPLTRVSGLDLDLESLPGLSVDNSVAESTYSTNNMSSY